jgi:UrcA family protein
MTTTTNKSFPRTCYVSLVLAASALASTSILSAEPGAEAQVTIRADRTATQVIGHTRSGIPIEQYQLTYRVSYADLDLARIDDADALKARVYKAAVLACKDLDKLYPMAEHDGSCVKKAEDGAKTQINNAIKMAQAQGRTTVR